MAIDQITTGVIKDDAVTAAKIPAGAVVADVGTGGIATANLADDAVTQAKIHDSVVLGGPSIGTIPNMIRTNAKTVTAAITFAGTENGVTAGPVTFSGSGSVTVTTGSTWHLLV